MAFLEPILFAYFAFSVIIFKVKIQLLHNRECTFYKTTMDVLEAALEEKGLPVQYEVILVADDERAKQYRFSGSPQIMVDGKDIDPQAERMTNFHASGCRIYFYKGKTLDSPPKEMILEALK